MKIKVTKSKQVTEEIDLELPYYFKHVLYEDQTHYCKLDHSGLSKISRYGNHISSHSRCDAQAYAEFINEGCKITEEEYNCQRKNMLVAKRMLLTANGDVFKPSGNAVRKAESLERDRREFRTCLHERVCPVCVHHPLATDVDGLYSLYTCPICGFEFDNRVRMW